MLTDDVPIDRRILQEAQTLLADGHQIILLAGHSPDLPAFETIDGVRVERVEIPFAGRRELLATRTSALIARIVNAGSTRSQRIVGSATNSGFSGTIGAFQRVGRLLSGVLRRAGRGEFRLRRKLGFVPKSPVTEALDSAVNATQRAASGTLASAQPIAARSLVSGIWRLWWVAGVINAKLTPRVLTLIRRTRRLPLRDAALATRVAYYRPDVVHAHDLPQLRAGVTAADRVGVPIVYDAHELYPEIGTLTKRQQRQLGRIERRFIRRCDHVITVNPYIAAEMAQRYRVPEPTVILNAIDGIGTAERAEALRDTVGLDEAARIVLFQGWLSPTRGLDHLVEAMSHTRDETHLVFMSYGDMVDQLRAHADRLGIGHRVHFVPAVPQSELLTWTRSADVGVIPYPAVDLNHHYCSPNKLFEFIQAGLPIVANDLPFLRDIVVGERIGTVAAIEDHRAFGAAIDRIAHSGPDERNELTQSLDSAAPKYNWGSQESTLRSIYAGLVVTPTAS